MKSYWSETRPNGKPVEAGTFCYIIDMEDGTAVIATYGSTMQEVLDKVATQNANAQAALARRMKAPAQPATETTTGRQRMSGDERMQATLDLQNPAKSAAAVVKLMADETGVDPQRQAIADFSSLCMAWQRTHPEFYPHPGNKKLLAETAGRQVGGKVGLITAEMLTQAFQELDQRGLLFEDPQNNHQETPPVLPGESQVQHVERPRGTRFATGSRGTSFRATQTPQSRTVKYTEAEIRSMPESKYRQLLESNDKDFAEACEFHFPQQQASA